MQTQIYTDGGCAPTNPGPAAWAVVIIEDGEKKSYSGRIGHGTNQIAELTAAIEGLSRVKPGTSLTLSSDSQYVIQGITTWRSSWLRRNWRNAKGEPVANRQLWERLFALCDERKVTARWVKGHSGDVNNELCDQLCTKELH